MRVCAFEHGLGVESAYGNVAPLAYSHQHTDTMVVNGLLLVHYTGLAQWHSGIAPFVRLCVGWPDLLRLRVGQYRNNILPCN